MCASKGMWETFFFLRLPWQMGRDAFALIHVRGERLSVNKKSKSASSVVVVTLSQTWTSSTHLVPFEAPPQDPEKGFIVQAVSNVNASEACFWLAHCTLSQTLTFLQGLHLELVSCWAGQRRGFGPGLRLGEMEPLWSPGWLGLPSEDLSITCTQIWTRMLRWREPASPQVSFNNLLVRFRVGLFGEQRGRL